jgi:mannose-6-phosphate isomerase
MVDPIFPIEGVIRPYEWGSRSAIQQLLDLEPDGRPAAELWFGAHSGDPSPALGTTLDRLISADAEALLGPTVVQQWGERLPFLLKVLAAESSLSMQVHPNREQARAGYEAEEAAQPSVRNYADPNPKPELLCALTSFEAVCGFRPVVETLSVLDDLAVPELAFLTDILRRPDGLRAAFTALLRHDDPAALAEAVAARATEDGPLRATWIAAHDFPGDIGVVLTLLLNYVRLAPGEAIYLAAGNVHSYLRGMGVEIMANSDNVLRCGLTPKHIDVAELLKVTDFSELADPRWRARDGVFRVPVPEFALRPVDDVAEVGGEGPRVVLCTQGTTSVGELVIGPGHAAFVVAGEPVTVRTDGAAFIASIG